MSRTSGGTGRSKRFRADGRAQSETIGMVLILGMVALGITAVIGFGAQALDASERRSEVAGAEQAMAQFDSRAAQVALGDSTVQSVPLGSSGRYRVAGADVASSAEAGTIEVTHTAADGFEIWTSGARKMGTVVHRNGGTELAYQGGGVWRRDGSGGSVMISPPEFHYRAGTLTLPILQVRGDSTTAGRTTGVVSREGKHFTQVYPSSGRTNPIEDGTITITVESEYCEGWQRYFEERTNAKPLTRCDGGERTSVELTTLGPQGQFDMLAGDGSESHAISGLDEGHGANAGLQSFQTVLRPDDGGNAFSSLDWSMYASTGDNSGLELNVRKSGGNTGCGDSVVLSLYYSENGRTYHGWQNDRTIKVRCIDENGDGVAEQQIIPIDFLDSSVNMQYVDVGSKNLVRFKSGDLASPMSFNQHAVDPDGSYDRGSTENLDFLVEHYFAVLGPGFEMQAEDGNNGNSVAEECSDDGTDCVPSTFTIEYTSNRVVRYLHVTENVVRVDLQ